MKTHASIDSARLNTSWLQCSPVAVLEVLQCVTCDACVDKEECH